MIFPPNNKKQFWVYIIPRMNIFTALCNRTLLLESCQYMSLLTESLDFTFTERINFHFLQLFFKITFYCSCAFFILFSFLKLVTLVSLLQESVEEERFRRQIVIKSQRFNDDFFSEGKLKILHRIEQVGIKRDKTMADKFMYISYYNTQN